MAHAASQKGPSISLLELCRLGLRAQVASVAVGDHSTRGMLLTKADALVLSADIVALLVGEEHVRGEATLGRIGICCSSWSAADIDEWDRKEAEAAS